MQFKRNYITLLFRMAVLLLGIWLMLSCDIEDEMEVCQYNTRLIYQYNRENTAPGNVLPQYVQSLDEYIFDEKGILVQANRLPGTSCFGEYVSETNLPEGKYTVITWGNKAEPSCINKAEPGVTTRKEMALYLDNPHTTKSGDTHQQDSERLYYGYRTFSVHKYGVSKVHVDMTHSHCVLDITVRWKNNAEVPQPGNYHMLLRQLPSRYDFMPEYKFKDKVCCNHNTAEDEYPKDTYEILHHITTVYETEHLVAHRKNIAMNTGRQINTQFISYRYRDDNHELLSIVSADGKQIMKEIDLYQFFSDMNIDLNTNLRQEFEIDIEIDGDKVVVGLVEVGDWEEGGSIGS